MDYGWRFLLEALQLQSFLGTQKPHDAAVAVQKLVTLLSQIVALLLKLVTEPFEKLNPSLQNRCIGG